MRFESTVAYLTHLTIAFTPEITPRLADAVWSRLREDTVRLALQFGLEGIALPASAAELVRHGPQQ